LLILKKYAIFQQNQCYKISQEKTMPQQPSKLMPAVYGGLLIGIVSGVPFLSWINCACCAGVMAGGILAVNLFRRDLDPRYHMDMGDGAQLGLMAGVFGAIVATALSQVFATVSFEMVRKIISTYVQDPEMEALFDRFRPDSFARGLIFIGFLINLVFYSIFGLIGGLIGISWYGKSTPPYYQQMDRPTTPPPVAPPDQDLTDTPL
jgi:hypothetical protein